MRRNPAALTMRLYEGAPDSALSARLTAEHRARKRLQAFGARATFFPMEGEWLVLRDNKQIGDFAPDLITACDRAIAILKQV